MVNWRWWLVRPWRKLTGRPGCRGEGYYIDDDGVLQPCYEVGCH